MVKSSPMEAGRESERVPKAKYKREEESRLVY